MQSQNTFNQPIIAQLGHPVLQKQAKLVDDILSDECQNLIGEMMVAVEKANGVGLAAPQIYQSLQVFIMCSKPSVRYPNAPSMQPTAIINPEIIEASEELEKGWEGCLSVPSMRGLVPRHKSISVRYYDQHAKMHTRVFDDFVARIFQHELDHLNGLTFIDRLESPRDLVSENYWYEHIVNKQ
ncbi:peptide deformylase [Pseudoalteromonas luteoviolacea]|uniref:peptide deformylase n=1 Tax=Pseudoalteromonas luteoviolacea TaxID=43657 RepID=UPI001EED05A6|nr:peptide deformylase [Pseudoalteromonas luteoviolacea]MCF6443050.1 peptide deformylase [Pseudoalteromonas luteoviolacea]